MESKYRAPNKLLEELVAKGELIRLKRGLLVLADQFNSLAAAASIHGPSYLSFETALSFYGLVPERVESIISVVDNRQFKIEAHHVTYIYRKQNRDLYSAGMSSTVYEGRNLLIATPEKAILDTIAWSGFNTKELSQKDVFDFVTESLRIEAVDLVRLSLPRLKRLSPLFRMRAPQKDRGFLAGTFPRTTPVISFSKFVN